MTEARLTLASILSLVAAALIAATWLSGATLFFTVIGLLVAAAWVSRRLARPVERLRDDVDGLMSGRWVSLPAQAPTAGIRALRQSINALAAETRDDQRAAERNRTDLRALMDRMDEGVLALDPDGTLRVANRAARDILGLDAEVLRPHLSAVPAREWRAFLETALQTSIRSREATVEERLVRAEANLLDDGVAIVSLRDVTDVRRLEEVRTDFVANASHELKTPLTAVRGFAETLLEDEPEPEIRKQFLKMIHDNTLRLQAIVEDLLDLSRLESGGWTPDPEPSRAAELALQAWEEVIEMRGESRQFEVQGDGMVEVDRSGLLHVLRNLLDNALRHTEQDGSIRVKVQGGDGETRITVADDGAGIPPDALPRIFERFFRVDRARSRAQGGTGLGLAIVSHLTSQMGGRVEAESQYGVGTQMHVILPTRVGGALESSDDSGGEAQPVDGALSSDPS